MPGLIPLMLTTERTPRMSLSLTPTPTSTVPATPTTISNRRAIPPALNFSQVFDLAFPLPKLSPQITGSPSRSPDRAPSRLATVDTPMSPVIAAFAAMNEGSPRNRPAPVATDIPYTVAEWGKAIAEVKRQFMSRRFRACSSRCTEILDNMRKENTVEPIYIISLHFYAACALEESARPLNPSSAFRTSLLQKAQTHYLQAQDLLKQEESAGPSTLTTPLPSLSRTFTPSMCSSSSPSPSIYSLDDAAPSVTVQTAPAKKRVTFSCDLEDPVIRPDSPTLGFEEFIGRESPEPVVIPRVPMHVTAMPPSALKQPKPVSPPPPVSKPVDPFTIFAEEDIALSRFYAILSSLKAEVTSHLNAVEQMLSEPKEEEALRAMSPSSGRSTPIELFRDNEEMKSLEIRSRIERLRSQGWQRRRFDARKYEVLAENALAELAHRHCLR